MRRHIMQSLLRAGQLECRTSSTPLSVLAQSAAADAASSRAGPAAAVHLAAARRAAPIAAARVQCLGSSRAYSTKLEHHQHELDRINELFVEARDEIEYAMEDAETVYFNESAADAKEVVQVALDAYQSLLDKLGPEERGKLERSMGLKMEQLKAEAAQLDTLHAD